MTAKRRAPKSNVARIDKLRDKDIDYSDIPELDDEVFAQPIVSRPPVKKTSKSAARPRVDQRLERHARADEHGGAAHNFGVTVDNGE